jgi:hypothetical protein
MYFNDGSILANAAPQWKMPDGEELPPLVVPDGQGPWAVRYIWCKHKENNDEFVENYFAAKEEQPEGEPGLNLRKRTAYMQEAWNPHNAIFETSRDNGNLVWRVKVHNPLANSIDYIEVWRSPEVISSLFHYIPPGESVKVTDGVERTSEDQIALRTNLYKEGFEVRRWYDNETDWPKVSPQLAMYWYWCFVKRHYAQDKCRVNTKWRINLNPWRGLYTEPHADIDQLIENLKPKQPTT